MSKNITHSRELKLKVIKERKISVSLKVQG